VLGEALATAKAIRVNPLAQKHWPRWRRIFRRNKSPVCLARRLRPPRPSGTSPLAHEPWPRWRRIFRWNKSPVCSARRLRPPRLLATNSLAHEPAALAPHLPPEQKPGALGEALATAKEAIGSGDRSQSHIPQINMFMSRPFDLFYYHSTSATTPGYHIFLAWILDLLGYSFVNEKTLALILINLAVGSVSVFVAWLMAKRLSAKPWHAAALVAPIAGSSYVLKLCHDG
jgi:hypothetical protein